MTKIPKVSMVVPCYGRPQRTKRSLECILNQDLIGWEVFFIGDGCSDFQQLITSDWFLDKVKNINEKNNLIYYNLEKNYGGYGFHIMNKAIQDATGEYFMFYSNDDVIESTHMSTYYNTIKSLKKDFVYFNSAVRFNDFFILRDSKLEKNHCGHSELIIKTSLIKQVKLHTQQYGHDFDLIENLMNATKNYCKAPSHLITYKVMSLPSRLEKGID